MLKYICCFPLYFKYIYRFYSIIYYIVNIVYFSPFFPCDLGVKIPIGRGGLCKTFMGALTITQFHKALDPRKSLALNSIMLKYIYYFLLRFKYIYRFYSIIYYVVDIVYFSPFFTCDLGVKIPIGRGGLCKTFTGALTTT